MKAAESDAGLDTEFTRGLGAFDATMVVVGSMIGSGIFLVSADMSRVLGSPGWLLVSWLITGLLTLAAALSYGELAAMMPRAIAATTEIATITPMMIHLTPLMRP